MCLNFTKHYQKLETVLSTLILNVDGIHDLKPRLNKDYVLGVSKSKTKKILLSGVKSMPKNIKIYIQGSIQAASISFRILVTTTNLYFSYPAKTDT